MENSQESKSIQITLTNGDCKLDFSNAFTASEFLFIAKLIEIRAESIILENLAGNSDNFAKKE